MRTTPWLLALLIANLVASVLHFGDNMFRFHEYPEPKWITGAHVVDMLWLVITPLLPLGWWLARRGMRWGSIGVFWLYGALSMSVLGHYLYASPSELPLRVNLFIGGEGRCFGDDMNVDAFLDELLTEFVNVRTDATHNSRRVFPGKHHDSHAFMLAHGRGLGRGRGR